MASDLTVLQRATAFKKLCMKMGDLERNSDELKKAMNTKEQLPGFIYHKKPPVIKPDPKVVSHYENVGRILEEEKMAIIRSLAGEDGSIDASLIIETYAQVRDAVLLKSSGIWTGDEIQVPSYVSADEMRKIICPKKLGPSSHRASGFTINRNPIQCPSPDHLDRVASSLSTRGKGIFCAAESTSEKGRRLAAKLLRDLMSDVKAVSDHLCGIVIYEQTTSEVRQRDGATFIHCMDEHNISCGLRVQPDSVDNFKETGLQYVEKGIKFAEVQLQIGLGNNHNLMAEVLVDFAAACQGMGLVPVLTPEIITDDSSDIQTVAKFTSQVLLSIFNLLNSKHVLLSSTLLKMGFVVPGSKFEQDVQQIAYHTLQVLECSVPRDVLVVFFLSGKVVKQNCTRVLNLLNQHETAWNLSFSFGRALQQKMLKSGEKAQMSAVEEFKILVRANAAASLGEYVEQE